MLQTVGHEHKPKIHGGEVQSHLFPPRLFEEGPGPATKEKDNGERNESEEEDDVEVEEAISVVEHGWLNPIQCRPPFSLLQKVVENNVDWGKEDLFVIKIVNEEHGANKDGCALKGPTDHLPAMNKESVQCHGEDKQQNKGPPQQSCSGRSSGCQGIISIKPRPECNHQSVHGKRRRKIARPGNKKARAEEEEKACVIGYIGSKTTVDGRQEVGLTKSTNETQDDLDSIKHLGFVENKETKKSPNFLMDDDVGVGA